MEEEKLDYQKIILELIQKSETLDTLIKNIIKTNYTDEQKAKISILIGMLMGGTSDDEK